MWWAIGATIAALMAWVAWYEREQRREFRRMVKQHNIQVREMNGHFRPLENDFVQLESRVEELEIDMRELLKAGVDVANAQETEQSDDRTASQIIDAWTEEERQAFHRAVCDYYNEWDFNTTEGKRRKMPEGGLREVVERFGFRYTNMRRLFTRHFMSAGEYDRMKRLHIVPNHFYAIAAGEPVFDSIQDPKALMQYVKHGRVIIGKHNDERME